MADVSKMLNIHALANSLLKEYELDEWSFDFNNHKRSVGLCDYNAKTIYYSMNFVEKTDLAEIENTIRHEIAHALVGSQHGHDRHWKAMARAVGARPETCTAAAQSTAKYNYVIKCENPDCPVQPEWKRYRMKRRNHGSRCPHCKHEVNIYKYNYTEV